MTLVDPTLLLLGRLAEDLSQLFSHAFVQCLPAALVDQYDMIFAFTSSGLKAFILVHPDSPPHAIAGSHRGVSLVDYT